jgi:hypothetical protein
VAQEGKARFLAERWTEIEELVRRGVRVCLPDLRGTGESAADDARGLRLTPSEATVISPAELMLGQTMLGRRLRDLRAVMRCLRAELGDHELRLAIWGDSFAALNPVGFVDPPVGGEDDPHRSEPMGAMLALLGGLFEDDVRAVVARRGLVGLASVLSSPFVYVPHDVIVPGALATGDLMDVAASLVPRPLRLEGLVDGRDCAVASSELEAWVEPVRSAYTREPGRLRVTPELGEDLAAWLDGAVVR